VTAFCIQCALTQEYRELHIRKRRGESHLLHCPASWGFPSVWLPDCVAGCLTSPMCWCVPLLGGWRGMRVATAGTVFAEYNAHWYVC
jgi:hypothetical protein